jgi:hypothetical protein
MKLGTVTKSDITAIGEIPRSVVRILWADDFYDVPLRGMADVRGSRYLYDVVDRSMLGTEEDESLIYWLIALSPEQLQEEEGWHDLFCRKMATHFDFTGRPAPSTEDVSLDDFYEPYRLRAQPDYASNEVIDWFRLSEATAPDPRAAADDGDT